MNAPKSKTRVPGESTDEGKNLGHQAGPGGGTAGDVKSPIEIPEGATQEDLLAAVRALQASQVALQLKLSQVESQKAPATHPHLTPVTMDKAKQMERDAIANGEVPTPTLTTEGWHVPALAHSGVDALEREQDRLDKAEQRKVRKDKA